MNPSPEALQEMEDAQADRADITMDNLVFKLFEFLVTLLKDVCEDDYEEDCEDTRRRSKRFFPRPSGDKGCFLPSFLPGLLPSLVPSPAILLLQMKTSSRTLRQKSRCNST